MQSDLVKVRCVNVYIWGVWVHTHIYTYTYIYTYKCKYLYKNSWTEKYSTENLYNASFYIYIYMKVSNIIYHIFSAFYIVKRLVIAYQYCHCLLSIW